MRPGFGPSRNIALAGCGLALLVLTGGGLEAQREYGIDGLVAVALGQGAVYAAAVGLAWRGPASRRAVLAILALALAMRVPVVLAPAYLSSDIYRYVWDGRVMGAGINPYRYVPNDPHLAGLRDAEIYPEINRGNYARTIYPPAAEAIFFAVTRVSESLLAMKLAMLGFEAAAVVPMLLLLAVSGQPLSRILIYAWHPLPLWEFAGSGHIDAAVVALVAAALWFGRIGGRGVVAGVALAGAALVKLYPAAILPALRRGGDWRLPAAFCAAIAAAYLPFLSAGRHVLGFLPDYVAEEGFTAGAGFFWWSLAKTVLPLDGASNLVYVAAAGGLVAALAVWVARLPPRSDSEIRSAALLATAAMVLMSPHYAWYFTWLVVFACLVPSPALVWLTVASFLLYLVPVWPQVVWNRHRLIVESAVYMPFLVLAAGEIWRYRRRGAGIS